MEQQAAPPPEPEPVREPSPAPAGPAPTSTQPVVAADGATAAPDAAQAGQEVMTTLASAVYEFSLQM